MLYVCALPSSLSWIPGVISSEMEIQLLDIDWGEWSSSIGVSFGDDCSPADLGPSSFSLFSLFMNFENL
jgi:hypothetical protein